MQTFMRKDTWGGVFLIAAAGFFIVNSIGLEFGTIDMMGPGLVPMVLAVTLLGLGILLVAKGLMGTSGEQIQVSRNIFRAVPIIFAAIIAFVILLYPLGYLVASFVMIMGAGFASPEMRPRELIVVAVFLSIASALTFIVALGVPMPLFPAALT